MFSVTTKHLFFWPVVVEKPSTTKPGDYDRFPLQLQFEQLSIEAATAEQAELAKLPQAERAKPENQFTFRRIKGWQDVVGPDAQPLAFSDAALKDAWNDVHFRRAAEEAYLEALSGDRPRLGN